MGKSNCTHPRGVGTAWRNRQGGVLVCIVLGHKPLRDDVVAHKSRSKERKTSVIRFIPSTYASESCTTTEQNNRRNVAP